MVPETITVWPDYSRVNLWRSLAGASSPFSGHNALTQELKVKGTCSQTVFSSGPLFTLQS